MLFGSPSPATDENQQYFEDIKKVVEKSPNRNNIFLYPFSPDVYLFYDAVDVVVIPSLSETYGMVTLESMLKGLPVLGANVLATPHLLGLGKYGWLYEPKSPQSLADSLTSLIYDENKVEILKKAKEYVKLNFDSSTEIDGMRNVINQLI